MDSAAERLGVKLPRAGTAGDSDAPTSLGRNGSREAPRRGPRSASTTGWTTRAPRAHSDPYGMYMSPAALHDPLKGGRSTRPSGAVATRRRPPALWPRLDAGTATIPVRGGQTSPPADSGNRRASDACHHLPGPLCRWGTPGGQDDTAANEQTPTLRTAFGMRVTTRLACRLPV